MDDGQQVMGKTHSSLGSGEQKISFSFPCISVGSKSSSE